MNRTHTNRRSLKASAMLVPVVLLTYWFAGASAVAPSGGYARRAIPAELRGQAVWLSEGDRELSARAIQILQTSDYLLRDYVERPGRGRVDLCIVFAQDNRTAIHPPEVCLRGEGSRITAQRRARVQLGNSQHVDVSELTVESKGRVRLYWYTYKVGPVFTVSFVRQQWLIWWNGLLRRQVGGALVRLSTIVRRRDLAAARDRLSSFSQSVFPHIITKLRLEPVTSP